MPDLRALLNRACRATPRLESGVVDEATMGVGSELSPKTSILGTKDLVVQD